MKIIYLIILVSVLSLSSCSNIHKLSPKIVDNNVSDIAVDSTNNIKSKEDLEREAYFGFDTLLVQEYLSANGNKIRLEGSKSKDVYRISVTTKKGVKKKFKIADNWYSASHLTILWDTKDYIFVRYYCGSSCWGGQILSLNDERGILGYPLYLFADSTEKIIVYPDTNNYSELIVENFRTNRSIKESFKFCKKFTMPTDAIDSVYKVNHDMIAVRFKNITCKEVETREIEYKNLN